MAVGTFFSNSKSSKKGYFLNGPAIQRRVFLRLPLVSCKIFSCNFKLCIPKSTNISERSIGPIDLLALSIAPYLIVNYRSCCTYICQKENIKINYFMNIPFWRVWKHKFVLFCYISSNSRILNEDLIEKEILVLRGGGWGFGYSRGFSSLREGGGELSAFIEEIKIFGLCLGMSVPGVVSRDIFIQTNPNKS